MILADTSILIAYLRSADAQLYADLKRHQAVICGITRAEVLWGVRDPTDQTRFMVALDTLPRVPIRDELWDAVGLNLARLRSAGLPMPFADVAIATVAMDLDIELWAQDQHFELIRSVLPRLRLFQAVP